MWQIIRYVSGLNLKIKELISECELLWDVNLVVWLKKEKSMNWNNTCCHGLIGVGGLVKYKNQWAEIVHANLGFICVSGICWVNKK